MLSMACLSVQYCTALVSSTVAPMAGQEWHIQIWSQACNTKSFKISHLAMACHASCHRAAEHVLTLAGQHTERKVAVQFAADNHFNNLAHLQNDHAVCRSVSVTTVCLSPQCVCQSVSVTTLYLSPHCVCHHSVSVTGCLSLNTQCIDSNHPIN